MLFLLSADFKQSPPNIPSPNINIRKRRHGEEEIYYIPVRFPSQHIYKIVKCVKFCLVEICVLTRRETNTFLPPNTEKNKIKISSYDSSGWLSYSVCCVHVQVRGRENFELLMKIKDSLELVELVPQPLIDSYRQQTQQQLLQRPWVTLTQTRTQPCKETQMLTLT